MPDLYYNVKIGVDRVNTRLYLVKYMVALCNLCLWIKIAGVIIEVDEAAKKNMEEDTKRTLDSMFGSQAVQEENFQKKRSVKACSPITGSQRQKVAQKVLFLIAKIGQQVRQLVSSITDFVKGLSGSAKQQGYERLDAHREISQGGQNSAKQQGYEPLNHTFDNSHNKTEMRMRIVKYYRLLKTVQSQLR